MLDLLISENKLPSQSLEAKANLHIERRSFMKSLFVAGVTVTLYPSISLADSYESETWKGHISDLVKAICPPSTANWMCSAITQSRVAQAPSPADFHSYFSAPLILVDARISPAQVVCSRFFEIDRFPFFDTQNPCKRIKDLNAHEIRRISYNQEIERFGCVVSPCSERFKPEKDDYPAFYRTVAAYNGDPNDFELNYKRSFNHGRPSWGYGVTKKGSTGANGKPLKDLLLSSEDI